MRIGVPDTAEEDEDEEEEEELKGTTTLRGAVLQACS